MHIETLKIFCNFVETGTFSKAASRNFVTQSAVSQQIRMLEDKYDQQLLERNRQRVSLTPTGELFYQNAKEIVRNYESLEEKMSESSGIVTGTVRVATIYSVGLHTLPRYIKS